jgi:poly-beta-1,6-N-acetyl-D-glucosamine synthase
MSTRLSYDNVFHQQYHENHMAVVALTVFVCATGFVIYALAGYPLLLWLTARRRPRPIHKQFVPRTVTVLLPVHNGEKWIREKLESILALDYPRELMQIVVLSDGSEDATDSIVSEFKDPSIEFIRVQKGGKAQALNRGILAARGDVLFFTDVRQRLEVDCLRRLVSCFADATVGGVCGEMIILDGETQEEASVGMYWKVEKWIRKQLSSSGTLLVVTGCVYAIRRELAEPLPPDALGDDIFMPQAILRKGFRVIFEDAAKVYDYPTIANVEFQRKVRTLAGLYQYLQRHGLGPHPFHFFSYKAARLLLPYALIAMIVSSLFLPNLLRELAIAGQVLFYGLAAIDPWVPDQMAVKRISSSVRTFCMLMIASLWAASVLFLPSSSLWKTTQVQVPKTRA